MAGKSWFLVSLVLIGFFSVVDAAPADDTVRIGIVTDVHAHDTNSPNEKKIMVNYAERIAAFTAAMTTWPADLVIELGDLANGAFVLGAPLGDPARIGGILADAVASLRSFPGPIVFVLGNHDVYDLSKDEFLAATGSPAAFYSLDVGAYHVVVLDAQYTRAGVDVARIGWMVQGTIPERQLSWLAADLAATDKPTIVLIHQPLDVVFDLLAGGPPVSNALAVRAVLAASGRVIAVFQGHDHENRHTVIDGIHYVTFAAMVDHDIPTTPTWAAITLDPAARTMVIEGVGAQDSLELTY